MLGFYCNPEFYFHRQKAKNAEKHVNIQYQSLLKKAELGQDLYDDSQDSIEEEGPVL